MPLAFYHHSVHSYLVGYEPFKTNNPWIPFYTLAKRKSYQLDKITYRGVEEVWQNSLQAFAFPRCDCEDHSLALTDWLISMGEDARVVVGDYKGQGHAWVLLVRNGKQYLIEATKKGLTHKSNFKLAKYQSGYNPSYMFNRHDFWLNTGHRRTSNYMSSSWIHKSTYTPALKNKS